MFPDLEFVKTCLNAITAKFRRVKSDIDAVQSNVDAVQSNVDAVKSDIEAVKSDAPNWNEPNSASHAYVKNKPCYDYIDPGVVIWASDSAEVSTVAGGGVIMSLILADLVDGWLIEGETYRLTVDGVETTYICAADADGRGLYIGAGYSSSSGSIYQSYTDTRLFVITKNLWSKGQKVRLEGPLRRYKKLDTTLYDGVVSVNGETGEVQITPENIGAASTGYARVNTGSGAYDIIAIRGTYNGATCNFLYLGGNGYFARGTTHDTGEECFLLGPKLTILAGIKTPTSDDQAANKAYVDETIATEVADCIKAPSTVEVGQAIVAKTVDENGKPTEWEAVDMGSGGKTAYQYAVEGGYTGTEAEFAAKLAQEKFANPNALTFTGAAEASYDGSEPVTVEIPSGGGGTGGSDISLGLTGATIGQIAKITAVDTNGTPTAWDPVDLPSGGGQAIDKISIKITETVHSISLLDDITLYNRIRANIKVVGDSANAASGVLGAITPSGALVNYILNATKTATGYLFFDLRLSEQGAESNVTPTFSSFAYNASALSHIYGADRTRWTGALSLVPNATDWNFGAGTEIYLEAYRA